MSATTTIGKRGPHVHDWRIGHSPRPRHGLVAVVGLILALLFGSIGPASATTEGLSYIEDTVFTVGDDSVMVEVSVMMRNTTSDERRGSTLYYTYFDEFFLPVPVGTTDLVVSSGGRILSPEFEELDTDFRLLTARLPTQLRSGESRQIEVSYRLPVGELRGDGVFHSNPAFHSFPLYSFSDPGTGSLEVWAPDGAQVTAFGNPLVIDRIVELSVVWVPERFDRPSELLTFVTVRRDDALVVTGLSVADQQIVLESWPNDDDWVAFARETIGEGLPALEEVIGYPMPEQNSLEITESVTPYLYGYAGWYDPEETTIEVGNELDDAVMLHELSHAWFNAGLFSERWIAEGLAEEFTWHAQERLGWPVDALPTEPRPDTHSLSLVEWGEPADSLVTEKTFEEREAWAYNAAWWTMRQIVEVAGIESVQDAISAAERDEISYLGSGPAERVSAVDDWRRFLDLTSERSDRGSVDEALVQIFREHVVAPGDHEQLDARAEARSAYDDFVSNGLGWEVPSSIRFHLSDWNFDEALASIDAAAALEDRYREVHEVALEAGLVLSDRARHGYESEPPDLEFSHAVLDMQTENIELVNSVRVVASTELSRSQRWGIGSVALEGFVRQAEAAYAADDTDAIRDALLATEFVLAESEHLGQRRLRSIAVAAAASFGLLSIGSVVLNGRRRSDDGVT